MSSLTLLRNAALKLRPLLADVVFVGGCASELLITNPGSPNLRQTFDVDLISEITSYADYAAFSEKLQGLGFTPDIREGAPVCRWRSGEVLVDVMPLDEKVLGFQAAGIPARFEPQPWQISEVDC